MTLQEGMALQQCMVFRSNMRYQYASVPVQWHVLIFGANNAPSKSAVHWRPLASHTEASSVVRYFVMKRLLLSGICLAEILTSAVLVLSRTFKLLCDWLPIHSGKLGA